MPTAESKVGEGGRKGRREGEGGGGERERERERERSDWWRPFSIITNVSLEGLESH